MVVFELKKGFPKNCEECPLFINKFAGYSAFCIGEAEYTTEEIEAEKNGNLVMYYHGCLSNRPKSCPLKEKFQKLPTSGCEYWDTESNYCTLYRPAAEKKGKWKEVQVPFGRDLTTKEYECEICGYQQLYHENFCGRCGARMEKEET